MKIKPCPFCGRVPKVTHEFNDDEEKLYTIEHECHVLIETGYSRDEDTVIEWWNRRV